MMFSKRLLSLFIAFFLVFLSIQVTAQILEPLTWKYSVSDVGNGEYDLLFEATIDPHWHLYTQTPVDDGPVPTTFAFEENPNVEFVGKVQEGESITAFEEILGVEISFFADYAKFTQRVKRIGEGQVEVKGELTFMLCDDKQCLPPEYVDFSFKLPAVNAASDVEKTLDLIAPTDGEAFESQQLLDPESAGIIEPVDWEFQNYK